LSIDNNIISTKVTTGNAPNNLKIICNIVDDAYAISKENSDEQGIINKINVLPNQSNLTPINNGGWISYVDEYGPTLHYVEGPLNVIADTLSYQGLHVTI